MNRLRSQIHKHVFIDIFVTILGFFLIIAWISLKEFNLCFRICASLLVLAVLFRIKFYILKDSKIVTLLRKKQIKYNDVKTIVFTLSYNDTGQLYTIPGLNSKMDFDVVSRAFKENGEKRYPAFVCIYLSEIKLKVNDFSNVVVNTELEHKPYIEEENIFNFICYDLDSLKQMLTVSDARIYVTRSYLYFNRWSINSFAKNIDVSIDRIRLINDDPSVIK